VSYEENHAKVVGIRPASGTAPMPTDTSLVWQSGGAGREALREELRRGEAVPYMWKNPINPVLDLGPSGSWDSGQVGFPVVVKHEGTYYMLYAGSLGDPVVAAEVGLATSTDGVTFERKGKVIEKRAPFAAGIVPTSIFRVMKDETFYMLATGWNSGNMFTQGRIYAFTSNDLVNWTLYSETPVITVGADENAVMRADVVLRGSDPVCRFVTCRVDGTRNLGYAKSSHDAPLTFTRYDVSDLPIAFGAYKEETDTYLEYLRFVRYVGAVKWGLMQHYTAAEGSNLRLVATGVQDTRGFMRGPILCVQSIGGADGWDSHFAGAHPYLVYDDETGLFRVYYAGLDRNLTHRIGLAWLNLHRIVQKPPTLYGYAYYHYAPIKDYSLGAGAGVDSHVIYSALWKRAIIKVYDSQAATVQIVESCGTEFRKINETIGDVSISANRMKSIVLEKPMSFYVRIIQGADAGTVTVFIILEGDG